MSEVCGRPFILAVDKTPDQEIIKLVDGVLSDPKIARLVSYIKLNDVLHGHERSGPSLVALIRHIIEGRGLKVGIMLDLKSADVADTDVNTFGHYAATPEEAPEILTVRENCSIKTFVELRRNFPLTKIALVSALTDIPEDECLRRCDGLLPLEKISRDIDTIVREYRLQVIREINYAETDQQKNTLSPEPFDMVVCSPNEVYELALKYGHRFQFIVPAIRDSWMLKGNQKRTNGSKYALEHGASYIVMGNQLTVGNPKEEISPKESRRRTVEEISTAHYAAIVPGNPLATLRNCNGFYESPEDSSGKYLGPLVAYAGKEPATEKNWVGFCYFNFSRAEVYPLVLNYYSKLLAEQMKSRNLQPTVILAAPMGGLKIADALARQLGCRAIFAEKKVTALANPDSGKKEKSEQIISRHELYPGDKVVVVEDVCNNFSTTAKLRKLIEACGAEMIGIACAINRSKQTTWEGLMVAAAVEKQAPEYSQGDEEIKPYIDALNIVWQPKNTKGWEQLMAAMDKK